MLTGKRITRSIAKRSPDDESPILKVRLAGQGGIDGSRRGEMQQKPDENMELNTGSRGVVESWAWRMLRSPVSVVNKQPALDWWIRESACKWKWKWM